MNNIFSDHHQNIVEPALSGEFLQFAGLLKEIDAKYGQTTFPPDYPEEK